MFWNCAMNGEQGKEVRVEHRGSGNQEKFALFKMSRINALFM